MTHYAKLLPLFACCLTVASAQPPKPQTSNMLPHAESFDAKLDRRVKQFDTSGRTLIANLIDLAYNYELPTGIEYVDRDAVTRPIHLRFENESIRGIITAIVEQAPEYRVDFTGKLVSVYSPKARQNSSNLLNKVISSFSATARDVHEADRDLFCVLVRDVAGTGCSSSVALGQWGSSRVTVNLLNARVYEILNDIVAQNGRAIWTVTVSGDKLSKIPVGGVWHIYPLDPVFKQAVLDKIEGVVAEAPKSMGTLKPSNGKVAGS